MHLVAAFDALARNETPYMPPTPMKMIPLKQPPPVRRNPTRTIERSSSPCLKRSFTFEGPWVVAFTNEALPEQHRVTSASFDATSQTMACDSGLIVKRMGDLPWIMIDTPSQYCKALFAVRKL